jgi:hypothetical protein
MRLTNQMENNELDRWVENVIVGEMGFDKNKVFSQSDFDQIRSLLVSELIDRYLKKTLSEQTQKIVGSLPEKKFEKLQLKKELKFLLKKIKLNPKEPYVESAVYQHKFFDEDSLSWLSIYQNHASLKGKNRSKSLIVSGLVSVLLLITAAFKPVNSQKKMEPVETSGKNILSMPHDIFDIRSQIKMQWPIHGDEIYIKAHGNSDTKVLVDPALFAAVLEVEKITDSDLPNQNLYEKVNFLRQLISNPQYSKNLFYVLARYYIEKYDRQSLPWLSQWQLNKNFTQRL